MYIGNGNTGGFNTGQSNVVSLDDAYPSCVKNPDNYLNRSRGAVGAYFPNGAQGLGKGMICGGNEGPEW